MGNDGGGGGATGWKSELKGMEKTTRVSISLRNAEVVYGTICAARGIVNHVIDPNDDGRMGILKLNRRSQSLVPSNECE